MLLVREGGAGKALRRVWPCLQAPPVPPPRECGVTPERAGPPLATGTQREPRTVCGHDPTPCHLPRYICREK